MAKSILKACVGLTAIAVTGMANAATFDFSPGNLGFADSESYNSISTSSIDGIGLTITAFTIVIDDSGDIQSRTQVMGEPDEGIFLRALGGLGVQSDDFGGDFDALDGQSIDSGLSEGLLFSFDRLVSLDYINFGLFTSEKGDGFNLTVDDADISILVGHNADVSNSLVSNVFDESGALIFDEYRFNSIVGSSFLFWADETSDSFFIETLEVSAVPVPAAAWLFGSALLGMFGFSRRKKA